MKQEGIKLLIKDFITNYKKQYEEEMEVGVDLDYKIDFKKKEVKIDWNNGECEELIYFKEINKFI